MQEDIPNACGLYPRDVSRGASEDTGLVLHRASDGAETYNAMDFPTVLPHLTQQRATRITLAGGGRALCVSEPSTDHGVPHSVTPKLLLFAGLMVNDGESSLVQRLSQRHVFFPTSCVSPAGYPAVVSWFQVGLLARQAGVTDEISGLDIRGGFDQCDNGGPG